MDVYDLLRQLGFAEYEAKAYIGLLRSGDCNGYEVAKTTGVPRANVYGVLERLVGRGAAQRLETGKGVRYVATSPQLLLASLEGKHRQTLEATRTALATLERAEDAAVVFSLRGHDELILRAVAEIEATHDTLLIALQPGEARQLAEPLRRARERGVGITSLCLEACEQECGGCQGDIHRLQMAPEQGVRWLLLVADRSTALLGQIDGAAGQGLVTAQPLVIELTSAYIRQSLALALLGNELAGRFDGLLSQQARELFDRLYPGEDFLARIQDRGVPASS